MCVIFVISITITISVSVRVRVSVRVKVDFRLFSLSWLPDQYLHLVTTLISNCCAICPKTSV